MVPANHPVEEAVGDVCVTVYLQDDDMGTSRNQP